MLILLLCSFLVTYTLCLVSFISQVKSVSFFFFLIILTHKYAHTVQHADKSGLTLTGSASQAVNRQIQRHRQIHTCPLLFITHINAYNGKTSNI